MEQYIQVVEEEEDDPVEIPAESDGTLELTTLTAQFPGATGLKYRNESTGNFRGLRVVDSKLQSPEEMWPSTIVFVVVYPKGHNSNAEGKRKGEHVFESSGSTAKMKKPAMEITETQKTHDLVILGLAYTANDSDITEYFEKFGQVLMTQIKRDHKTNKSKGFGFVRMGDYESQIKVLSQRHMICGRWCEVKLPNSNQNRNSADNELLNRKIFVGRCTEEVTQEDLRDYFTKFGEVVDVYIPKPFRAFAFVTFSNPIVAASLCGQDHLINNASVHISAADPKENFNKGGHRGGGDDFGRNRYGRGRSNSPNRGGNPMGNQGMNQQGPGGNMPNQMPGFNMGNFPMNQAMFAALASQGMFGMPNMMGGMGGNQGGYGNQQQQPPQGGGNFNYGGYNNPSGYGGSGGGGGYSGQGQVSNGNSSWGSPTPIDSKQDIKGTNAAGWNQGQSQSNSNSSWNQN
ncbi:TAR DNA-binding protein 43-like [Watersipora subatra]|uniref:TAR DNA-binding protein 43-like n=1 Tax=Watersipora subatra TaxID=2589382 RepID=UPI00355B9C7A